MRLINADELKKTLLEYNYTTEHNQIFRYIDEQPTAYDVNKVAEQLQEWTFNADIKLDNSSINRNLIVSETAIEIVKAGGIDER